MKKSNQKLTFIKPKVFIENECLVIGSSASLLKKSTLNIDNFNNIIRFNRAPTDGYEKYVGSRTDYRFLNNHVFENRKIWYDMVLWITTWICL